MPNRLRLFPQLLLVSNLKWAAWAAGPAAGRGLLLHAPCSNSAASAVAAACLLPVHHNGTPYIPSSFFELIC